VWPAIVREKFIIRLDDELLRAERSRTALSGCAVDGFQELNYPDHSRTMIAVKVTSF
jgi:hypothetical protein